MTILELKDQIMHNSLSNFYIFVGEEIGIINIYLQQMSNKINLPITRSDSVSSIYGQCMGGSLFGDNYGFYVIRNDNDFPKHEEAYKTISEDIGKNNTIVLLYDKIDSRLKFGKFFKDKTVVFEKLAPNVLKSYMKKEINLNDANLSKLSDICNGSYDMCMLEIDKIKQYQGGCNSDKTKPEMLDDLAFEHLLADGVIYQPEETDVFKFTDAVCSRNVQEAFRIEQVLRDAGTSSVTILGTLYNNLKSIMLIQACSDRDISSVTGLDNRQIYFNKKYINKYTLSELVVAVRLVSQTVSGIKSGFVDDSYATRYALVHFI